MVSKLKYIILKILLFSLAGLYGIYADINGLIQFCIVFIMVDFILGVITNYKSSKFKDERFGFQSDKFWKTILKCAAVIVAISMARYFEINTYSIFGMQICKLFAGLIAGSEFWSILGHLCYISDWDIFNKLKPILKKEIENKTGHNIEL